MSSSTVARLRDAWTTRPTSPSPVTTGMPVAIPSSLPLSAAIVDSKFPGEPAIDLRVDAAEVWR